MAERRSELTEAERIESESSFVEPSQIEIRSHGLADILTTLAPRALTHLVAERLGGATEVSRNFVSGWHIPLVTPISEQFLGERRRRPNAVSGQIRAVGNWSLQVQSDIEDDARCAQESRQYEPDQGARLPVVAQFVHQTFGIERPPLLTSGDSTQHIHVTCQPVPGVHLLPDLQMVPRHPFAIRDVRGSPFWWWCLARRNSPPHAARPGQII